MIVLLLVATLPLSFLCMSILTMAAVATCLRAFALHQYTQRLSELAVHEQGEGGQGEGGDGGGSASGGAAALSSAAQRRPRRPSTLLTAVAAAGRPFSLLHLRLSLVERDFTEPGDYELLLRLDELEAGMQQAAQAPPPLPEAQLAQLPVHVHRTPTKKSRKQRSTPFDLTPRAGAGEGAEPATPASCGGKRRPAAAAQQASWVPVVVEPPPPQWLPPAAAAAAGGAMSSSSSHASLAGARPAAGGARAGGEGEGEARGEIVPATPTAAAPAHASESEESEEDEEILCSVCLEPFDDGAKILSLPCRHQYHEGCVKTWLRYKGLDATCPNCVAKVFSRSHAGPPRQAAPAPSAT